MNYCLPAAQATKWSRLLCVLMVWTTGSNAAPDPDLFDGRAASLGAPPAVTADGGVRIAVEQPLLKARNARSIGANRQVPRGGIQRNKVDVSPEFFAELGERDRLLLGVVHPVD